MVKKYEAVISGISGKFAGCSNVRDLEANSYNGKNLVTYQQNMDENVGQMPMPKYVGVAKKADEFDPIFFGVHKKLAGVIHFFNKYSLTETYQALCDAGLNPGDFRGTKTAVVTTSMICESSSNIFKNRFESMHGMATLGYALSMNANRVSHYFDFTGPSLNLYSAWTGSLQTIEIASQMIETGQVRMVIVAAFNKLYTPFFSYHYEGLKDLSTNGKTKSFSADADGYSRSDGWSAMVLQRAEDAFKSYGSIVKVLTTQMFSEPSHIVDPVGFSDFIQDFYSDVNIKVDDLAYIECDGSASKKLDALELNGLTEGLCKNQTKPLLVSCCKSRLGHAEAAAGLVSVVQALIALKNNCIPPTLDYSTPNPEVPALHDGRIKVVTENTPLKGDYVGVTVISMINAFGHILIKKNPKSVAPKSMEYFPPDGIPRLFLLTGRDYDHMNKILNKVLEKPVDENYYALNHNVFKKSALNHFVRGFTVRGDDKTAIRIGEINYRKPIWYIFTGMGAQWPGMGTSLLKIPTVRKSLEKSAKILATKGVDLMHILTTLEPIIFDNILNAFVGIAAIQVALVDLLEEMGLVPDGIVGHSTGELGCAYADKCLTTEQAMLVAYGRGKASIETKLIRGMMAAVGMGYKEIKDKLPEGIEVACHNSSTSCTLSGPTELMEELVAKLKKDGVFTKLVNVSNIAYHSKYIKPAGPYYSSFLKDVIPEPIMRSSKWISSSVPEEKWDTAGLYCSSQYFVNNLLNYVLFEEATQHIPKNAICIEIAPHGLLQAIVRKSLPDCIHIPLNDRRYQGNFFLIDAIGNLFMQGIDVNVSKLYLPVEFPVPQETDFHDVITWNTSGDPCADGVKNIMVSQKSFNKSEPWKTFTLTLREVIKIQNHRFKGTPYIPKSKILMNMAGIELQIQKETKETQKNCNSFLFQNLHFNQDLQCDLEDDLTISCLLQQGTHHFEVIHDSHSLISSCLFVLPIPLPESYKGEEFMTYQWKQAELGENDIYEFFEDMGYDLMPPFRNIIGLTIFNNGFWAKVEWKNNFELYLESVLKLLELYVSIKLDSVVFLQTIDRLLIDPKELSKEDCVIYVYYDEKLKLLTAKGIRLFMFETKTLSADLGKTYELRSKHFLPYSKIDPEVNFVDCCLEIIKENCMTLQMTVNQRNQICTDIEHSIHLRHSSVKYQININKLAKVLEVKDCFTYLIIGDRDSLKDVEKLIEARIPFYFIYTGSADFSGKLAKHLTCILEQQTVALYKQKENSFNGCGFFDMGDTGISDKTALLKQQNVSYKICFCIFKYRYISEIMAILELPFYKASNMRLVFLDESCNKFNVSSDFFKLQLLKGLKVNIVMRGVWGSLMKKTIAQISPNKFVSSYPLSSLRCLPIDVEVIGINLKSLVYPDKYRNIGVIEYSGLKNGKKVFGLGRLIEGNYLETDALLCWEKPEHWNMEDAVTVPLYYFMAYDMLKVRGRNLLRIRRSLLIHVGHTLFSQVIIKVALSLNMEVFTTCFSTLQKQVILENFPQVKENNVVVLAGTNDDSFGDRIMKTTGGKGPYIVIDNLEITTMRTETSRCGVNLGYHFLLTNDEMDNSFTFGMGLTRYDVGFYGYNPEMIFDMTEEDKVLVGGLMQEGIICQVVEPLARCNLPNTLTPSQAADNIVEKCQEDLPMKFVMTTQNQAKPVSVFHHIKTDHSALIIGGDKGLWFDLLKWLVSKGVNSVCILLDQNTVPHNLKLRFSEFEKKLKYASLSLSDLNKLNSVEICSGIINSLSPPLDSVFYVKKEVGTDLSNLDTALRLYNKNTNLITIGNQVPHVSEVRHRDGLRNVSFVVLKENINNLIIINSLDLLLSNSSHDHVIEIQEQGLPANEVLGESIFPKTGSDLVELGCNVSKEPGLVEIVARCQPKKRANDLDPVILFPGLQLNRIKQFASQLYNPTFMATYPDKFKSLHYLATTFTEILVKKFSSNLFTLVAEGWAGPLVLTIAILLEEQGKASSISLLNAAPHTVQNWSKHLKTFFFHHLPFNVQDKINVNVLQRNIVELKSSICKESRGALLEEEVLAGLEILISRLQAVEDYTTEGKTLNKSSVYLFNTDKTLMNSLYEMCPHFCRQFLVKSPGNMLEDKFLIQLVNELVIQEYKSITKTPEVKNISSIKLALEKWTEQGL